MYGYDDSEPGPIHVVAPPRSGAAELVDLLRRGTTGPVDGTADLALAVPELARDTTAYFVYFYRDPRETISSMLDAWRSGVHTIDPQPPGWEGPPWSFPLVDDWPSFRGVDLPEIVARQWASISTAVLDALEALPSERWCVTSYDRLLESPQAEAERIARFCGRSWDRSTATTRSRHGVDSPEPRRWEHNAADLDRVWSHADDAAKRALEVFATPPRTRPRRPPTTTNVDVPDDTEPDDRSGSFRSIHTTNLPRLLDQLEITLFVTTYQSGRLIAVRTDGEELNTHFRMFRSPMGLAVDRERITLGTNQSVIDYRNQPAVAAKLHPKGRHDAAYLPRVDHHTGEIQIHEVARLAGETWLVATRFSCLATLDERHSFVPRWRPPFVSAIAAEDRCHLNGMAVVDDEIRYVTAMGETDSMGGWRDRKVDGGVVLEVPSGEVVTRGLSMPHSPRVRDGRLWVLSSGRGEVCTVDVTTGEREVVAKLPGFTRGLAFAGRYAFVGLSQVRESIFGGIPLADELSENERRCGVWVIDTTTGATVAFLQFEGAVQEIFDVQVLAGIRWPELAEVGSKLSASSFVLPDDVMADVFVARP